METEKRLMIAISQGVTVGSPARKKGNYCRFPRRAARKPAQNNFFSKWLNLPEFG
jgi:hypothetical protein